MQKSNPQNTPTSWLDLVNKFDIGAARFNFTIDKLIEGLKQNPANASFIVPQLIEYGDKRLGQERASLAARVLDVSGVPFTEAHHVIYLKMLSRQIGELIQIGGMHETQNNARKNPQLIKSTTAKHLSAELVVGAERVEMINESMTEHGLESSVIAGAAGKLVAARYGYSDEIALMLSRLIDPLYGHEPQSLALSSKAFTPK